MRFVNFCGVKYFVTYSASSCRAGSCPPTPTQGIKSGRRVPALLTDPVFATFVVETIPFSRHRNRRVVLHLPGGSRVDQVFSCDLVGEFIQAVFDVV